MNKLQLIQDLTSEVFGCTSCNLYKFATNPVLYRGSLEAKVLFIGEGPGQSEDEQGLPFVGRAGKLLDNMIQSMGFSPKNVGITNVVRHRPPSNRTPLPEEIQACYPFLLRQIKLIDPKIIVTLGNTPLFTLLGQGAGVTKRRGIWYKWNDIDVMVTFHPAYLLRNQASKKEAWADLQLVMAKCDELNIQRR